MMTSIIGVFLKETVLPKLAGDVLYKIVNAVAKKTLFRKEEDAKTFTEAITKPMILRTDYKSETEEIFKALTNSPGSLDTFWKELHEAIQNEKDSPKNSGTFIATGNTAQYQQFIQSFQGDNKFGVAHDKE